MPRSEPLLVTDEVAALLQVHPKQVYRLLARGLPGRRVGREWRFDREEVLAWVAGGVPVAPAAQARPAAAPSHDAPPPLLAANGDVVVELLLSRAAEAGTLLGFVPADRDGALEHLRAGRVLLAGSHGEAPPEHLGEIRLARIHLVVREVGLAAARGGSVPELDRLAGLRIAARPPSAGIRRHLEAALRAAKVRARVLDRAVAHASHRDVVHAVARGDADLGLTTRAWADRLGLAFRALATEPYGLVVRARDLGDPRVVRVCEVAQSAVYRADLGRVPGYDPTHSGAVEYHFAG